MILGYWPFKGRAQYFRYLLAYLKMEYKEVNPDYVDYFKTRKNLPFDFPNIPYIMDDDYNITDSNAIQKYILYKANREDLEGKDINEHIQHKIVTGVLKDVENILFAIVLSNDAMKTYKKMKSFVIDPKFLYLNKYLGDKEYFLGELKVVDIMFLWVVEFLEKIEKYLKADNTLDSFPGLAKLQIRVASQKEIKKYRETDERMQLPTAPPIAKISLD